jgi:hypothetical protein
MRAAGLKLSVLDASAFPEPLGAELFSEPEAVMKRRAASLYEQYAESRAELQSGRLVLCINNDPGVNAHALPGVRDSVITINGGTCVRLRQLFQFAVLDRETFPEEPDEDTLIDAEKAKFGVEPHSLLEPADLALRAGQPSIDDYIHLFAPLPNTVRRRDLAQALYSAALDYVVLHETAHIVRQHKKYFDQGSAMRFSETLDDKYRLPSSQPSLVHIIEADADLTASHFGASSLCMGSETIEFWRGWAQDSAQAVELWLFAIAFALNLLDGWSDERDTRTWYPHPAGRVSLVLLQAAWSVSNESGIDEPRMKEILHEAHFRALMAWARLGLPTDIAMDRGRPFMEWDSWSQQAVQLYNEVQSTMYPADDPRLGDRRTS